MVEAVYSIKNVRKEIVAMKVKYNVVWGKIQNIITLTLVFTSYFYLFRMKQFSEYWAVYVPSISPIYQALP